VGAAAGERGEAVVLVPAHKDRALAALAGKLGPAVRQLGDVYAGGRFAQVNADGAAVHHLDLAHPGVEAHLAAQGLEAGDEGLPELGLGVAAEPLHADGVAGLGEVKALAQGELGGVELLRGHEVHRVGRLIGEDAPEGEGGAVFVPLGDGAAAQGGAGGGGLKALQVLEAGAQISLKTFVAEVFALGAKAADEGAEAPAGVRVHLAAAQR
jgi:hypothetical protein